MTIEDFATYYAICMLGIKSLAWVVLALNSWNRSLPYAKGFALWGLVTASTLLAMLVAL